MQAVNSCSCAKLILGADGSFCSQGEMTNHDAMGIRWLLLKPGARFATSARASVGGELVTKSQSRRESVFNPAVRKRRFKRPQSNQVAHIVTWRRRSESVV